MADPFSAASSAIGVISLGLQVAQQLITFCQAYKNYNEDARRIDAKAESMRRPLKALRDLIEDAQVSNPELASDLSEKALGMQRMVNRLKTAIEMNLPVITDRFPERIKGQLKRAVYPFRKDGLREMFDDLDGIQNSLQTTLSIHSTQKMTKLGLMQEAILEEVQQIRITLQEFPDGMPPPALLKSWCDSQSEYDNKLVTETHITAESEFVGFTASSDFASREVVPFKPRSCEKTETVKSFKYLSSLLRVAVTASFSLSKGAGGFSIAPSLSVQTILKYSDSILKLQMIQSINMKKTTVSEFDQTIDHCIRQAQQAFSAGKSRPSDIFYFDYALRDHNMFSYVDALVLFDMATTRNQLPGLNKLTRFLVESGSRPNNTFSEGVLRGLLRFTRFQEDEYALASYLVDHGGPCTVDDGTLNHIERYNVKYILSRAEEILIVPEVARILFQESEDELRAGLKSGHIAANDRACGCSLLQLAFGWPSGIQILLKAGAAVGQTPLINFWGCPSPLSEGDPEFDSFLNSTTALLDAGAQLKIEHLQIATSPRLLSLFANELAKRRWKLWKLAKSYLPWNELPELEMAEQTVPDIHASHLCAALAARDKTIDSSLLVQPHYASAYHKPTLRPRVMEELFKVGFKHLDFPDSAGVVPLMMIFEGFSDQWNIILRVSWLVLKGADVGRKLPVSDAKVAHLIAVKITRALLAELPLHAELPLQKAESIYTRWSRWERDVSKHRETLFHYHVVDGCTCPCCPHGCTPISVALRQALRWPRWSSVLEGSFWFRRFLQASLEWHPRSAQNSKSIIRLLTFDALGLKHTCCIEIDTENREADKMQARDEEEIAEIRYENQRGVQILESLMLDFEAKFDGLGLSLIEFLEGYWHTRMVEHLLECDPYDEEHHQGTRSIGVILQEEESDLGRVSLFIGAQVKEVDDYDADGRSLL